MILQISKFLYFLTYNQFCFFKKSIKILSYLKYTGYKKKFDVFGKFFIINKNFKRRGVHEQSDKRTLWICYRNF